MKILKRVLVFILFCFAFIGVMSVNYFSVKAVDYAIVLSDTFEAYEVSSTYNSTKEYNNDDFNGHWLFFQGTNSTNNALTSSKSGQMRWYSSTKDKIPYAILTLNEAINVDKVSFNYKINSSGVTFTVSYSTDGEDNNVVETVTPTLNAKTSYSKEFASSVTIKSFKIALGGTAPSSGNYPFIFDDLVFSTKATLVQLSVPSNVRFTGNVLSFDAVTGAVSYNIGFYESESAEEPTKVININSTTYTFTQQSADGNNYIKIQTLGNGVTNKSSDYGYVGTYTYTDIPVKTIAEADALTTETVAPYSYYDITGMVTRIKDASSSNLYISDGSTELYVYGLRAEKGGNYVSTTTLGIEEGFIIRIRAYKWLYVNNNDSIVEFCGYLVSSTPNYENQFSLKSSMASLKLNYTSNSGEAPANSQATMTFPTSEITTSSNISYSFALGLNPSIFKVTCAKNNASTATAIRNDSIRLYTNKTDGNGGEMTIEGVNGITIRKVVLTYTEGQYKNGTISGTSSIDISNTDLTYTYFFNTATPYVTIKNEQTNGTQVRFSAMTIYYSGSYASSYTINTETVAEVEKPIVSLMFGGILSSTLKGHLDSNGASVTYGVVYAKSSTLTDLDKSLEEALEAGDAGIYTAAGIPVKVNADGTENPEGSYYQVGVALNHISESNYDTEITAATYVCIDGTYSLMNEKAYSVKSIARAYCLADNSSYIEHLGVLGYLANYGD